MPVDMRMKRSGNYPVCIRLNNLRPTTGKQVRLLLSFVPQALYIGRKITRKEKRAVTTGIGTLYKRKVLKYCMPAAHTGTELNASVKLITRRSNVRRNSCCHKKSSARPKKNPAVLQQDLYLYKQNLFFVFVRKEMVKRSYHAWSLWRRRFYLYIETGIFNGFDGIVSKRTY